MTGHRILSGPDARLRTTPWRGDPATAQVMPGKGRVSSSAVTRLLRELSGGPYTTVLTTALAAVDQAAFLEAGFTVHERLHLLVRDLEDLPDSEGDRVNLRRAHHGDRVTILAVDAAAFPAFWQLDQHGLEEAVAATPSSRLRVATDRAHPHSVTAYAVTGRAGPRGYLQRLAVDPRHQGHGTGAALVADSLRWLRRWGAKEVLVNTQEGNERAVRLYERLGFNRQTDGLAVLRRTIREGAW